MVSALVWAFIFLVIADQVVVSGVLWKTLAERRAHAVVTRVEASMFRHAPIAPDQIIIIGDSDFDKAMREQLPEDVVAVSVIHEWMDLDAAGNLLRMVASSAPRAILVQNLPWYWSDAFPDYWNDNLRVHTSTLLWDATQSAGDRWSVGRIVDNARALIDALAQWAEQNEPRADAKSNRPETLFEAGFVSPEHRSRANRELMLMLLPDRALSSSVRSGADALALSIKSITIPDGLLNRVYWVSDLSNPPPDTPPALIDDFNAYFAPGRVHDKLGTFVTFEQVADVARNVGKAGDAK